MAGSAAGARKRGAGKQTRPAKGKASKARAKGVSSSSTGRARKKGARDVGTSVGQEGPGPDPGGALRRLTATEAADRELAASALQKRRRKQKPTREEMAALRRVEKQEERRLRWQYYETVPQKDYREMVGRQTKQLQDVAARWGIPCDSRTISLPKVLRAFHDFVARHARVLSAAKGVGEDDMSGGGAGSEALEKYRHERYLLSRLERLERERVLLPREEVHEGLAHVAAFYRSMQEKLERSFGREVADMMEDDLAEAEAAMLERFGTVAVDQRSTRRSATTNGHE